MSNTIQTISATQFTEFTKTGTALVDFWHPACGPCRMQGRILEEMADDNDLSEVKFLKVNVQEAMALAEEFEIASVPTLYVFKNGERVKEFIGVQNAEILKKSLLD